MIEHTILNNLILNEEYSRKALPYITNEYLTEEKYKVIYTAINAFISKYNKLPSKEALLIDINDMTIAENVYDEVVSTLETFEDEQADQEWLLDKTEKFCQDRAIYNAIMDSIKIIDGRDKKNDRGAIPELLVTALGVSFNKDIGHDYLWMAEERYEFYTKPEHKVEFDIDILNKITKGGFSKKTLNLFVAGTGVGKSLTMCHMAAANLMNNKNVLYITGEMAEERIAERIDANLLNINLDDLVITPKENYLSMMNKLKTKTTGNLIIKEYPTASAHVGHFRHLLNELRLKKDFVPDIIYIDYINIFASSRFKPGLTGMYQYIKGISEEFRGLAVEYKVPVVTATQLNRGGLDASDVSLGETSESIGLPFTVDFMAAIIQTEDMRPLNQFLFKQLKNRYNNLDFYNKFGVGVDKAKMRLYDLEETAQKDISQSNTASDDMPVFDQGNINARFNKEKLKDLIV